MKDQSDITFGYLVKVQKQFIICESCYQKRDDQTWILLKFAESRKAIFAKDLKKEYVYDICAKKLRSIAGLALVKRK